MTTDNKQAEMGKWLAIGVALGVVFGVVSGDFVVGMIAGLGIAGVIIYTKLRRSEY